MRPPRRASAASRSRGGRPKGPWGGGVVRVLTGHRSLQALATPEALRLLAPQAPPASQDLDTLLTTVTQDTSSDGLIQILIKIYHAMYTFTKQLDENTKRKYMDTNKNEYFALIITYVKRSLTHLKLISLGCLCIFLNSIGRDGVSSRNSSLSVTIDWSSSVLRVVDAWWCSRNGGGSV